MRWYWFDSNSIQGIDRGIQWRHVHGALLRQVLSPKRINDCQPESGPYSSLKQCLPPFPTLPLIRTPLRRRSTMSLLRRKSPVWGMLTPKSRIVTEHYRTQGDNRIHPDCDAYNPLIGWAATLTGHGSGETWVGSFMWRTRQAHISLVADSETQLTLTFIGNNVSHKFDEIENDSHVNVSFLNPTSTSWASWVKIPL